MHSIKDVTKLIYCFLADGFEEVEAISPIDMLRRAGAEVKTVGVTGKIVTGAHGIPVEADITEDEISLDAGVQAVILPGGMPGTLNLEKSETVKEAVRFAAGNGKLVCAICAAPSILGHMGLLDGKEAIAYPGFEKDLIGASVSDKYVVRDGTFITAKGAGVAVDFGLEIVCALFGKEASDNIRKSIQCL